MPNTPPVTHDAVRDFERVGALEREIAELRQRIAVLSSSAAGHLSLASPHRADLLASESRYRTLVELSPQAMWMTDAQGNTTFTTRYWHEYSGLTAEETIGAGWTSALHPDDKEAMLQGWMEAVAQGVPYETVARLRRGSNGQYRWHLIRGMPVRGAEGEIGNWTGSAVDVHDHKTSAAVIAEAEERVRFMEAAGVGTCGIYPLLGKKEWSGPGFEMLGVPRDQEPSLELFMSRVHPEDRQLLLDELQRLLDLKAPSEYSIDYRVVWPD